MLSRPSYPTLASSTLRFNPSHPSALYPPSLPALLSINHPILIFPLLQCLPTALHSPSLTTSLTLPRPFRHFSPSRSSLTSRHSLNFPTRPVYSCAPPPALSLPLYPYLCILLTHSLTIPLFLLGLVISVSYVPLLSLPMSHSHVRTSFLPLDFPFLLLLSPLFILLSRPIAS